MLRAFLIFTIVVIGYYARAGERARPYSAGQYDVQLAVDPATRTIRGQVVISMTANRDGVKEFDLDCGALTIDGVDIDDTHTPLAFEKRADTLHIRLPRAWSRGEPRRVRVRYHGQPRAGLEFVGNGW